MPKPPVQVCCMTFGQSERSAHEHPANGLGAFSRKPALLCFLQFRN